MFDCSVSPESESDLLLAGSDVTRKFSLWRLL